MLRLIDEVAQEFQDFCGISLEKDGIRNAINNLTKKKKAVGTFCCTLSSIKKIRASRSIFISLQTNVHI